jgi:gamma-glutamyltranspeptidase
MKKEFGDQVEFVGVNVTVSETRAGVDAYVREHGVPFRTLYDEQGIAARAYNPPATSYIVIVDRSGKVVYTGAGGTQNLEPALRQVTGR